MAGEKILIVDDEEEILVLLSRRLIKEGYQIIKARSGEETIEKTKELLPHLIVMDLMMPGLGGGEAVKVLKKTPTTKEIPIILLTGMVSKSEETTDFGIQIDSRQYRTIAKPFDHDKLLAQIKKALN